MLRKVDPSSTLRNNFFQLATLKFVAWQVEHAVVIRATTRSNCNATVLRHKLNENVARITWTLPCNSNLNLNRELPFTKTIDSQRKN